MTTEPQGAPSLLVQWIQLSISWKDVPHAEISWEGSEGRGRQGWAPWELAPVQMKGSEPPAPRRRLPVLCGCPGWLEPPDASLLGSSRCALACREPGMPQRRGPQCAPAPPGVPAVGVLSSVSFAAGKRKSLTEKASEVQRRS